MPHLTEKEQRRVKGLQAALAKLQADERISNRTLQNWLTREQYDRIDAEWKDEKDRRSEFAQKPDEIRHYEALLKKATFAENKAEHASRQRSRRAKELAYAAEAMFERALEYIVEQIACYPHLQAWLDRTPTTEPDSDLSLVRVSMPKVITSRSLDNFCSGAGKTTLRQIKIRVVQQALAELLPEPTAANGAHRSTLGSAKLRAFIEKLE